MKTFDTQPADRHPSRAVELCARSGLRPELAAYFALEARELSPARQALERGNLSKTGLRQTAD